MSALFGAWAELEPELDPETNQPRWVSSSGHYVLADSCIGGGGVCIRDARGYIVEYGTARVAAIIGELHPALAACAAYTEAGREAQRACSRELAQILRFGVLS